MKRQHCNSVAGRRTRIRLREIAVDVTKRTIDATHQKWSSARENRYDIETWDQFWSRAQTLLGYDHRKFLDTTPPGKEIIGDAGLPVLKYVEMLDEVGFQIIEILARSYSTATIAAMKNL